MGLFNDPFLYYDRQGNVIDRDRMQELLGDPDYKVIAQTELPEVGFWISTVWLPFDHSFTRHMPGHENDPPIIFETMVFPRKGHMSELSMDRYATEEEAVKGHHNMVRELLREQAATDAIFDQLVRAYERSIGT